MALRSFDLLMLLMSTPSVGAFATGPRVCQSHYRHLAACMTTAPEAAPTPQGATYDPLSLPDVARIHADADRFFDDVDTDGNGFICSSELRDHLAITKAELAADSIFSLLDVNADGEISREELRKAFESYEAPALRLALGLGTVEADRIFSQIDSNGDGEITKQELVDYMGEGGFPLDSGTADSIFSTLDTNGDGAVSRDELRTGYVRFSALRNALGLGGAGTGTQNPKGAPKRWGRGGKKVSLDLTPPLATPDSMRTDSERRRLMPIQPLERERAVRPIQR